MTRARFWLAVLIIVSVGVGWNAMNRGDFAIFYNAGRAVLDGQSPYGPLVHGYYNPLYVAIAFVPFALLPEMISNKIFAGLTFFLWGLSFYFITRRSIRLTILFMLTPFPLMTAYLANLDELIVLGALVFPIVGVWLVMIKPQIGIIVAVLLLSRSVDRRDWRALAWLTIPLGISYLDSLAVGMWRTTPINAHWNWSLWPLGLLIGLPAVIYALRKRSTDAALFAGPFVAPYLGGPAGLALALPLLSRRWYWAAGAFVASWLIFLKWESGV